jgi:UDP-2,3-diacylglucosamine pyrophosphatase LpxH
MKASPYRAGLFLCLKIRKLRLAQTMEMRKLRLAQKQTRQNMTKLTMLN